MNETSISVRVGAGVIEHNNREFIPKNVVVERMSNNIIYINENIKDVYDKLFSEALKEYNENQIRADRRINNYLEHIMKSKKEKVFYEAIIQFGDKDDTGVGTPGGERAKNMLNEYMTDFQKRNPHLYVFNAAMHLDEATPHLHIDFVPFATNQKQGLSTRVSLKKALEQQGVSGKSVKESDRQQWALIEKSVMRKIAKKYGVRVKNKNVHRSHLNVDEFKAFAQEIERLEKLTGNTTGRPSSEYTQEEINFFRNKIAELKNENTDLRKKQSYKRKDFIFLDEHKLKFIADKLKSEITDISIEGQIIRVPEWAEKRISELESIYRPPQTSWREQARLNIDSLVYSAKSLDGLWDSLKQKGYEIKQGRYISIKPPGAERFIRTKSLGADYTESALISRIAAANALSKELNNSIKYSVGIEREFFITYKSVYTLFIKQKIEPRKIDKSKPFSIKNDKSINELVTCLNIIQSERLSSEADILKHMEGIEEKIGSLKNRLSELRAMQEAIVDVKDKARLYFNRHTAEGDIRQEMRVVAKEILDEYGIEDENDLRTVDEKYLKNENEIAAVNQSIAAESEKLAASAKLLNFYEQIQNGGYINSLMKKEIDAGRAEEQRNAPNLN